MRKSVVMVLVVMALIVAVAVPQAGALSITVGTPGSDSNAFPFGGKYDGNPGTVYQQVYNEALFPHMSISSVTFFNSFGYSIDAATYSIYLSTTTYPVNGLDTVTLSNNVGADNKLLWSGFLSGNPGATFSFSGPAFNYNPANGNLLVEVLKAGGSDYYEGFFDAMNGNFGTDSSRAHNFGSGFTSYGLVTRFGSSVPVPPSVILLGSGLLGLGGWRRFRKS